ncbi:MAG: DNA repair protein RadA [Microthrixaceae bacterium]|nr:DNA repair protein RadA [Acidimicrobiales bacterium]MCB9403027.1 DNA repair protein RadA [Microthrixaceae bacterium]
MAKVRTVFRCPDCGASAPKWVGQCPGCAAWGSLVEELDAPLEAVAHALVASSGPPVPIAEVDPTEFTPRPTGVDELDRVLGGGLVPGSVTLLTGEPGIGKSTVLLQAAATVASSGRTVLYLSGEESPQQVRLRAERLGALHPGLFLAAETALPHLISAIDQVQPELVVVDSVQTLVAPELSSAPGSVAQVRECSHRLVQEAKRRGCAVVLVGHVTKEGTLAGPRVLEHVVDTVLAFEGDRHHALRLLRVTKHRFGSTQELGLFEMTESGLVGVPDASGLFLADRRVGVPGSVVVPTMEGVRPILVELQALVADSNLPAPRRSAQGVDSGRLSMILAVVERRVGFPLAKLDVFTLAVGGMKVLEPGADLAVALAVASAMQGRPVPPDLVACGEIGLGGELRQVAHTPRRLAEAARLGFTRAIVPHSAPHDVGGIELIRVGTLLEAMDRLDLFDI